MNLFLRRINTLKLSGIKAILGIDVCEDGISLVELKCSGSVFNKFQTRYKVVSSSVIEFDQEYTAEEKGQRLASELKDREVRTRFCSAGIRSDTARTIVVDVPTDVEDIKTWIAENHERFIRVPIPLSELAFSYELSVQEGQSRRCKISFIRETERKEFVSLIATAGLYLLSLGLVDDQPFNDPVVNALIPEGYSGNRAVEIAMNGFLPELSSMDFLRVEERKKAVQQKDKSLFQRSAIVSGVVLFFLLALQAGLDSYLQNESSKVDERLLEIGPVYSQVNQLERRVGALRSELKGVGFTEHRSNVSKVLHDLADVIPDRVWLYKLDIAEDDSGIKTINLLGYARDNQRAATCLDALQADKHFTNVQVIRMGAPTQVEAASFINDSMHSFVTFELRLSAK